MSRRKTQIGFSQRIRLEWFEQTANLILAGNDKAAINAFLQKLLENKVSVGGESVRGNREKVIDIMLKTWLSVPCELAQLRNEGLKILQVIPLKHRIAVHWSMVQTVYPFWDAVAAHTGRLLRLQGTVAASQIQRRIKEEYGERETASRAARRVLRTFIDWGVLNDTTHKGIYERGERYSIDESRTVAWMVEASLHARVNRAAPIRELQENPSYFPFRLAPISAEHLASLSPRMEAFRHSLDDDLVMLCKEGQAYKD